MEVNNLNNTKRNKLKANTENLEQIKPILFRFLEQGHPIQECCEAAGISPNAVYQYHKRVEYDDEVSDDIVNFVSEFKAARANGMQFLLRAKAANTLKI